MEGCSTARHEHNLNIYTYSGVARGRLGGPLCHLHQWAGLQLTFSLFTVSSLWIWHTALTYILKVHSIWSTTKNSCYIGKYIAWETLISGHGQGKFFAQHTPLMTRQPLYTDDRDSQWAFTSCNEHVLHNGSSVAYCHRLWDQWWGITGIDSWFYEFSDCPISNKKMVKQQLSGRGTAALHPPPHLFRCRILLQVWRKQPRNFRKMTLRTYGRMCVGFSEVLSFPRATYHEVSVDGEMKGWED